jgi:hypothetical protein
MLQGSFQNKQENDTNYPKLLNRQYAEQQRLQLQFYVGTTHRYLKIRKTPGPENISLYLRLQKNGQESPE